MYSLFLAKEMTNRLTGIKVAVVKSKKVEIGGADSGSSYDESVDDR